MEAKTHGREIAPVSVVGVFSRRAAENAPAVHGSCATPFNNNITHSGGPSTQLVSPRPRWSEIFKTPLSWTSDCRTPATNGPLNLRFPVPNSTVTLARGSWVGRTLRYCGGGTAARKKATPYFRADHAFPMSEKDIFPSTATGSAIFSSSSDTPEQPADLQTTSILAAAQARENAGKRKHHALSVEREATRNVHLLEMRAYFEDVDREVLLEESPRRHPRTFHAFADPDHQQATPCPPAHCMDGDQNCQQDLLAHQPLCSSDIQCLPDKALLTHSARHPCAQPDTILREIPPWDSQRSNLPHQQHEMDTQNWRSSLPGSADTSCTTTRLLRRSVLIPTNRAEETPHRTAYPPLHARHALPNSAPGHQSNRMISFTPVSYSDKPSAEAGELPGKDGQTPATHASRPGSTLDLPLLHAAVSSCTAAHSVPPLAQKADLESVQSPASESSPLLQLLRFCGQQLEILPSMDALLAGFCNPSAGFTKVGEGMLGEAYRCGGSVFKIMPIEGAMLVNGAAQRRADEVLAEIKIAHTLSALRHGGGDVQRAEPEYATPGFIELQRAAVCRGRYSTALEAEWHRWDKEHGSENDAVGCFDDAQLFVVLSFSEGGIDLEHFEVGSYSEAVSVLHQATLALAIAEKSCEFEHRDLHWGNILLRRNDKKSTSCIYGGRHYTVDTAGVEVALIDFTLSRLVTSEGEIAYCDLENDPELFQGPKADCQAETYRRMRKACKSQWSGHYPVTNSLWLHYLADVFLGPKQHQMLASASQLRELRGFKKRAYASKSAADLVNDEVFLMHVAVQP